MLCCTLWTVLSTMLLSLVEPSVLLQLVDNHVNRLQQHSWFNKLQQHCYITSILFVGCSARIYKKPIRLYFQMIVFHKLLLALFGWWLFMKTFLNSPIMKWFFLQGMITENQVQRTDGKTDLGMVCKVAGIMWKRCSPEVWQVGMQSAILRTYRNGKGGYYIVQDGNCLTIEQCTPLLICLFQWSSCRNENTWLPSSPADTYVDDLIKLLKWSSTAMFIGIPRVKQNKPHTLITMFLLWISKEYS